MIHSWPDMRCLFLNEEVVYSGEVEVPQGLNIADLALLTKFPQLTDLGAYLQVDEYFKVMQVPPSPEFPKLENLSVGTSAITKETTINDVALLFASLMSNEDMIISWGVSEWFPITDFQAEAADWWEKVATS
ncbi:hypothetical protein FRC03_003498 [Tulasnella sp. 419]|nr:hypothetical protein FRC03_003498 [Tulasnella sp. 419]